MNPDTPQRPQLSAREREVLALVVDGQSNEEIARQLCISPRTVQSHIAAAIQKTDTRNRLQLAVYALREGLVPFPPADEPQS